MLLYQALINVPVKIGNATISANVGGVFELSQDYWRTQAEGTGLWGMGFAQLGCSPTCVTPVFDLLVISARSFAILSLRHLFS